MSSTPPIFLVGPARSGTSLLYKVLCMHTDAAYISNWVARFPRFRWLAAFDRVAGRLPRARRHVWFGEDSNAYVYGSRRRLLERLFPMPVEGEPVYAACGISEWGPGASGAAAARLREAFDAISRYSGGSLLVSKRIANNRRIPSLLRAFPAARFVSIVRDGRAVAYSLSRVDWWDSSVVWWYGGTPRRWREEGRDPWELCARNWTEELLEIEGGLSEVPEDQVLRLSYESFVADPRRSISDVAAFAGLPPSRLWDAGIAGLDFPDRNEAWRQRLEPEIADQITAIQLEKLRAYGYER